MNRPLMFRPQPINGESLRGYLMRLAEANCISNLVWLSQASEEIELLRPMIGTTLQGRLPRWLIKIYGWNIPSKGRLEGCLMTTYARCCPQCLNEKRYWPAEWEQVFYLACHRHGCAMSTHCPDCSRLLEWTRPSLFHCSCGSDITQWPNGRNVTAAERQLCAQLAACMAKEAGRMLLTDAPELDNLFDNIKTEELIRLICIFGSYGAPEASRKSRRWLDKLNMNEAPSLVPIAAEILTAWPKRFHLFLAKLGGYGTPDVMRSDPKPEFVSFARCLRKHFTSPGLDFVMAAFRSFAVESWHRVLDRRNKWVSPLDYDEQRYLPAAEVTRHLHISRSRVKELLGENILRGYVKKTPLDREFAVIERRSLIDAEDLINDYIPLKAVSVLLGLPRERINELVTCGLLSETSRRQGAKQARLFSRKEVAVFVKRLSAGRREPSDEEGLLTTSTILKVHLATEKEFCSFFAAVIARRLPSVCVSPLKSGFSALGFLRREFYLWRSEMRATVRSDLLTITAAARELGVKEQVAYHLVHVGLLPSINSTLGKRRCRQVSIGDLAYFKATYISAAELATRWSTSPKAIVRILQAQGAEPVSGPRIDSGRQYFFRRRDALASPQC